MNIWEDIRNRFTCKEIADEQGVDTAKKKTICPFCNYEKNPSFFVTDEYFVCHHAGCNKKGDIFNLVSYFFDTDRLGALKILAKRAGVSFVMSDEDKKREDRSETFKTFLEYFAFKSTESEPYQYCLSRGLQPDFIKKKLLGYIPVGFERANLPELLKKTKTLKDLNLPEHLQGRIIFPFWQGSQVVYISGKKFEDVEGSEFNDRKYLNIYGEKPYIGTMRGPNLILSEGIIDQLLAEQNGYNCIGLSGTSKDIKIHKGIKKVWVFIECDKSGVKNRENFGISFFEQGADVFIGFLPEGEDLADHLCAGGKIEDIKTIPIIDYFLDMLKECPRDEELKIKAFRLLRRLDEMNREFEFKKLKDIWQLSIGVIRRSFFDFCKESASNKFKTSDGDSFSIPESFVLSENGILNRNNVHLTYEPIYISAVGHNSKTGEQFVEVSFHLNGSCKKKIVSRQMVSTIMELITLSSYGAPVNSGNALEIIKFLEAFMASNMSIFPSFEVTNELGWYGDKFIMPDRIISRSTTETVHYQGSVDTDAYRSHGDVKEWIKIIKRIAPLKDAFIARFCIYAGFSSVVMEKCNILPFIIHLTHDTSNGKTTAQKMAASIYGEPSLGKAIISWNITDITIIRIMEQLRHLPLIIDELLGKNMKNFTSLIYTITGGMSKGKSDRKDPLKFVKLRTFRNIVISSGEGVMVEDLSYGGQNVRVFELNGHPFGGLNDKDFIDGICSDLLNHHGCAIEHFIKYFLEIGDAFNNDKIGSFYQRKIGETLSNTENRILRVLDVIYMVGLLSEEIFKFGFDVRSDLLKIFDMLRKPLIQKGEGEEIFEEIRGYVSENRFSFPYAKDGPGGSRIIDYIDAKTPQKIFGYLFPRTDGGFDLGVIRRHFKIWMNEALNSRTGGVYILNMLKQRHLIKDDSLRLRIEGKREYFVYFENFFPYRDTDQEANDELPFG